MKVQNPSFIAFDGTPVTGRIPPTLTLMSGAMTPERMSGVAHAYKLFCDAKKVALGDYMVRTRKLDDGTVVRMVATGVHTDFEMNRVFVWAPPTEAGLDLPHGFVVSTNWTRPKIYKRRTKPSPVRWLIAEDVAVPQARQDLGTDTLVLAWRNSHYVNHTLAMSKTRTAVWDYKKGSASSTWTDENSIAFSLALKGGVGHPYSITPVHFTKKEHVYNEGGAPLFTAASSTPILASPEDPVYLPAATTANGTKLVMQHVRQGAISPTFGIYQVKFKSEVVLRNDAPTAYRTELSKETSIVVPEPVPTGDLTSVFDLEEQVKDKVWMMVAGSAYFGWSNGGSSALVGWRAHLDDRVESNLIEYTQARTDKQSPLIPTPKTYLNLAALAGATDVSWAALLYATSCSRSVMWRGGVKSAELTLVEDEFPSAHWGITHFRAFRIDLNWREYTLPDVRLQLGWTDVRVVRGELVGSMEGRLYYDIETPSAGPLVWGWINSWTYVTPWEAGPGPDSGNEEVFIPWLEANNIKNPKLLDIYAAYWSVPERKKILWDNRPKNDGRYDVTSMHIIDYDHKGRFYAAIEVRATCESARWREGGEYAGYMGPKYPCFQPNDVVHTVEISFVSNWNGVTARKVLTTAASTAETARHLFEFTEIERWNPYYYGTIFEGLYPVRVRMPPHISPPVAAMQQLRTIAHHQGVNPHLACEDFREDVSAGVHSEHGIEFSHSAPLKPHEKQVTGQLYARTFKLSDVQDALWLLSATKMDANASGGENINDDSPSYYYMPDLGATIANTKFHIEVRDGVIMNWSDEFAGAPGTGDNPGSATDREIRINRV